MFKQLLPLLSTRSLVMTITLVAEDNIRVTVCPRSTGKDDPKELSQPFIVEGTAEELDTDLPHAISTYTAEHMTFTRSLALVKSSMGAALKEAKVESDKKIADAKKNGKPNSTTKVELPKPELKKVSAPSLFDAPDDVTPPATGETKLSEAVRASHSDEDAEETEETEDEPKEKPNHSSGATLTPKTTAPVSYSPPTANAQPGMFEMSLTTTTEEDEILKEAFYEGSRIAA